MATLRSCLGGVGLFAPLSGRFAGVLPKDPRRAEVHDLCHAESVTYKVALRTGVGLMDYRARLYDRNQHNFSAE